MVKGVKTQVQPRIGVLTPFRILEALEARPRREFLISKAWIQAVVLVVLCGFFVLGSLAYRTYMAHSPVPARVVDENGGVLFTGRDISKGQKVFLHNGLMEYGSVFGHGALWGVKNAVRVARKDDLQAERGF